MAASSTAAKVAMPARRAVSPETGRSGVFAEQCYEARKKGVRTQAERQ